ncbi:DUF4112 domain-containing protein [Palleronia pelagia]|uniref:DUF4112 domain-containing protein n=1 Tax=Palleronia pelagia TaxID=387096 RepID=A0A1H8B0X9_9RHOB|nr:DUF4112 domain-containing protein [Palleronia pelagia]SEM76622.1 protein of unknown function [Palleronia pelagia]
MNTLPDFDRLARLERLAARMDTAFGIPGTRYRIGWDTLLGLVPGVGDALALTPAAYIVLESHRMGLPRHKLVRQGVNCAVDFAVGSVPILGDLFDAGFKANRRNVAILREDLERRAATATPTQKAPAKGEGHLSSHHPGLGGGA